jgi:hypothetical protein
VGAGCHDGYVAHIIRATIEGPDAQLGRIPASDVARLILGLEKALARAAYLALGRQRRAETGRHQAAIERATRLRFAGIDKGSFVELLALPEGAEPTDDEFPLSVEALGEAAFAQLLGAFSGDANTVDQRLAEAIADLADDLGVGDRNDAVRLQPDSRERPAVVIDRGVRERMRAASTARTPERDDVIVGTLVEADFERFTARLQPPTGKAVTVTFPNELADDIQNALRLVTTLVGMVSYDPKTQTARRVETRRVSRSEQLALSVGEFGGFFDDISVELLRVAQGVEPVASAADLYDDTLTDEERDELAALLLAE